MDNKIKRLPDAELEVMKAVWAAREPVTRAQLEQLLGSKKQWASTTILAMLTRLEQKGFLEREKQGRAYRIRPLVSQEEYIQVESQSALGRMFGGSAKNLIAALHQCHALSRQEVQELADYLEELKQEEE
ncbi:BlaI/MecI/CopY family transcriptional regulator [Allofournierella massiliensis]|uniref:BlaI/MecI/CopY family transcriptional regulator n=1 Tax=Allofournierella massiliensis TaxID=1650663 RepID=UPI0024B24760|nr:BlaI/MecI/CopY family transcriptional regulator [Fournierella massiliensis]